MQGRSPPISRAMPGRRFPLFIPALFAGALSLAPAVAPAYGQEQRPDLKPSPAEADRYRDFCRQRPDQCSGRFEIDRDRMMQQDLQRQLDEIRRNEERLRQLQAPPK